MHRGCFVWTPTPPLLSRRTLRPGPARVCVLAPLGQVGLAGLSGAFCAPDLFLWPSCPSSLFGPHRAAVARALGVFFFPFVFLLSFPLRSRAPVASGFLCFPAPGALGLGAPRLLPPPLCVFVSCVFCPLAPPPPPLLLFFPSPFLLVQPPPRFAVFWFFFPSFPSVCFPS